MPDSNTKQEEINKLYHLLLQRNSYNIQAIRHFTKRASRSAFFKKTHILPQLPTHRNLSIPNLQTSPVINSHKKIVSEHQAGAYQVKRRDNIFDRVDANKNKKLHTCKIALPNKTRCFKNFATQQSSLENRDTEEGVPLPKKQSQPAYLTYKNQHHKAFLNFQQITFPNVTNSKQILQCTHRISMGKLPQKSPKRKLIFINKENQKNLRSLCEDKSETKGFFPNIKKSDRQLKIKHILNVTFFKPKMSVKGQKVQTEQSSHI